MNPQDRWEQEKIIELYRNKLIFHFEMENKDKPSGISSMSPIRRSLASL